MKNSLVKWRKSLLIVLVLLAMSSSGCAPKGLGCAVYPTPPILTDEIADQMEQIVNLKPQPTELILYVGDLEAMSAGVEHGNAAP